MHNSNSDFLLQVMPFLKSCCEILTSARWCVYKGSVNCGQTSTCMTGLTDSNSSSCVPLPSVSRATTETTQLHNGHLGSGHYPSTSRTMFENLDITVGGGEIRDSSGGPGNVPPGWSEVAKVKSTDPKHHVYSTVGESYKAVKLEYHGGSRTLATGAGLSSEHQSSFSQLYQQDHEVSTCIQTVNFSDCHILLVLLQYFMIVILVELCTYPVLFIFYFFLPVEKPCCTFHV